jgi:hypothetical protein
MTDTVTRTATRATGGAREAGGRVGDRVVGEAARKAMSEAGNKVLGTVVDMAISRVDRVADRLDGVAESGGTGLREALTGRPASTRPQQKNAGATGTAKRAGMGAAFSLVVSRAAALLQFLQRLALTLLEALRRLARRPGTAPAELQAAGADEDSPRQDAASEDGRASKRPESRDAERRGPCTQRTAAPGPRPRRSAPAESAARRGRPAPPATRSSRTR